MVNLGNMFTTSLHAINSAVLKLSKLTKATKLYRGVAGGVLPSAFWRANEFSVRGGVDTFYSHLLSIHTFSIHTFHAKVRGGVDRAFMSCTTHRDVALGYASGRGSGILFEIQQGMCATPASAPLLAHT